jgi:hypothetical protein
MYEELSERLALILRYASPEIKTAADMDIRALFDRMMEELLSNSETQTELPSPVSKWISEHKNR